MLDVLYVLKTMSASWTKLTKLKEVDKICHFAGLKETRTFLYSKHYIRNSLHQAGLKSSRGCFVISGIRYIRFVLTPVSVESDLRQKIQRKTLS